MKDERLPELPVRPLPSAGEGGAGSPAGPPAWGAAVRSGPAFLPPPHPQPSEAPE